MDLCNYFVCRQNLVVMSIKSVWEFGPYIIHRRVRAGVCTEINCAAETHSGQGSILLWRW